MIRIQISDDLKARAIQEADEHDEFIDEYFGDGHDYLKEITRLLREILNTDSPTT